MYGKYRVNGNFDRVIENISNIVSVRNKYGRGPKIVFKNILFKHNEAYLQETKSLCSSLGVDSLQIVPCICSPYQEYNLIKRLMPIGEEAKIRRVKRVDLVNNYTYLVDDLDSPYCSAQFNNPAINVEGIVTPCCTNSMPIGSLLETDFNTIWKSKTYNDIRLKILYNRYSDEWCKMCGRGQNSFGHLFDGTILEYKRLPIYTDNYLDLTKLTIDKEYMEYLISNNLSKDIEYFKRSNVLSEEAQRMIH